MTGGEFFRRHYLITALVLLFSLAVAFLLNHLIMRATRPTVEANPPLFFARLVDELVPHNRLASLKRIDSLSDRKMRIRLALVDAEGKVLYPPELALPFEWTNTQKPKGELEATSFGTADAEPPKPNGSIIRLTGDAPVEYLLTIRDFGRDMFRESHFAPMPGPPGGPGNYGPRFGGGPGGPGNHGPPTWMLFVSFSLVAIAVLLGSALSLFLIFKNINDKVVMADRVIAEMQSGNLKARFPIKRMDEIGRAMSRFNQMADEIERLVEHLRGVESARMSLLQDLAHDLRTPVASLKNLLETMKKAGVTLKPELQAELFSLSLREVDYFERLVEDLLVLAQVGEPRYQPEKHDVPLAELFEDEAENVATRYHEKGVKLVKELPSGEVPFSGDVHLLRRMFRNTLENAFSFAKSSVTIRMARKGDSLEISIEDDGPGLSKEALKTFGVRRATRVMAKNSDGRLSVGLGSVILKTVAQVHRGDVQVENKNTSDGSSGARVTILLPT